LRADAAANGEVVVAVRCGRKPAEEDEINRAGRVC
jgi:hypothetical protein